MLPCLVKPKPPPVGTDCQSFPGSFLGVISVLRILLCIQTEKKKKFNLSKIVLHYLFKKLKSISFPKPPSLFIQPR